MPKKCGHVMCKKCIEEYCKDNFCIVCSTQMKAEEMINLMESGSSFSFHSNVEAKKYSPAFTAWNFFITRPELLKLKLLLNFFHKKIIEYLRRTKKIFRTHMHSFNHSSLPMFVIPCMSIPVMSIGGSGSICLHLF